MTLSNAERQARHRVKKLAETRAARAAVVTAEQSRRRVQAMIEEMANTRYVAGAQRAIGSIILACLIHGWGKFPPT